MYTDLSTSVRAFVASLVINAMLLGSTAYLFDGQVHRGGELLAAVASVALPQG
jgi:hypothetical protein